jgi:XTP/dITP diphosphohydrolase
MNSEKKKLKSFKKLLDLMDELREKCPWDKEQTIESLSHLTIEETYELFDAIVNNNEDEIKSELGDLLMHIVFYSKIASEENSFDIGDVIETVVDKIIFRHPHVFGNIKIESSDDVKKIWEISKLKEEKNNVKSVLNGVPKSLPSVIKAFRIQEKAAGVGFEWKSKDDVWLKVEEELEEFKNEVIIGNKSSIEKEFGDVIFSLINYARFLKINPEVSLERTNKKFISRFQFMENEARKNNNELSDLNLNKMEEYWELSKKNYS